MEGRVFFLIFLIFSNEFVGFIMVELYNHVKCTNMGTLNLGT